MDEPIVRTERVWLRRWRDDDLEPFAALNADPEVMEHFPSVQTRAESDAAAARLRAFIETHGYGFWALELPGVAPFAGFVGLKPVPPEVPFAPAIEIGWRLARAYWGRGYATEAARAALEYGFTALQLDAIVAMTAASNLRSRRVMEAIGMQRDAAGDFEHPLVAEGHRVRPHVLYRLPHASWRQARHSVRRPGRRGSA